MIYCSSIEGLEYFDISKVTNKRAMFTNVKTNCLITVKDVTTKAWVEARNSNLINVVVKSA